jgi:two-component system chemotaxis response regulator CheB
MPVNAEIQPGAQETTPAGLTVLIVIASSAGGVAALAEIFDRLPSDLPVAIAIVQHIDPIRQSRLPEILSRHTAMRVKAAEHGDHIQTGTVYIAPPDYHLMACQGATLELSHQAQVRFSRPSADHLFQSAAEHYAGNVIAVVLTGMGQDGSLGVEAVHRAGGIVIVQDPDTAQSASMPASAIQTGLVDHIVPLDKIADAIVAVLETGDVT